QHSAFDPLERRLSQFQLVLRQWHGPSPVTHSPGEHRGSGAAPDFLEARIRDTDPQIQGAEIAKKMSVRTLETSRGFPMSPFGAARWLAREPLRFHLNPGGSFDGYPIRTLGGGLTASERDQSRLRQPQ